MIRCMKNYAKYERKALPDRHGRRRNIKRPLKTVHVKVWT